MSDFPWFPFGYRIPGGMTGPLRREGPGYQVVAMQEAGRVALVLEGSSFIGRAAEGLPSSAMHSFSSFEFGAKSYLSQVFGKDEQPVIIKEWSKVMGLPTSPQLSGLSNAVRKLRERFPKADIGRTLYLPALEECLPTSETNKPQDLRLLAVEVLAGGAPIASTDVLAVRSVNSWLQPEEIEKFLVTLGVTTDADHAHTVDPASFSLPGRPRLEKFFREYVLEPYADRERYAALGVRTPNGILLYGPPGSGKSHAVAKLKAALGWPSFEIDLGAMGSPYIHQTSVALRQIFSEAQRKAPAIVVMEEVDALATSRGPNTQSYKTEEITELLRLVETASENNILVIGTTNRRDSLDPAFLRKGRFDHEEEVGYPDRDEVRHALDSMLRDRPHGALPNLDRLAASLAKRPMSDISWVVNEAARLAVRAKKSSIDEIDLFSALGSLRKS
jgi:cell division protease FtsH